MGSSPIPTPTPSSPTYVPSFPFYDAEPYWPKGGYGHHGGEEGSGSAATTDFYIFVDENVVDENVLMPKILYLLGDESRIDLESELMTIEIVVDDKTVTSYCYCYKDCPVGARIYCSSPLPALYYSDQLLPPPLGSGPLSMNSRPLYCPMPINDLYIVGLVEPESSPAT